MTDQIWQPDRYNQFRAERRAPFDDLLTMLEPCPGGSVVDLGCGTGDLTAVLHEHLGAATALGIDSSPAMLDRTSEIDQPGVGFELADMSQGLHGRTFDVVFSNAALHWIPDHQTVLHRWREALRPGGQLAVQVPANSDHIAAVVVREVAEKYATLAGSSPPPDAVAANVLTPATYAELLHEVGFNRQRVRLEVYSHELPATESLIDWLDGTSLTRLRSWLTDELYRKYLAELRSELFVRIGAKRPYFFAFKRILMWGSLG